MWQEESILNSDVQEKIVSNLGLDQSVFVRYVNYLKNLFQADLGYSYFLEKPVTELIRINFLNTFQLSGFALLLAILFSVFLSLLSVWIRWPFLKRFIDFLIRAGISLPVLLLGPLLIYIFSIRTQWLPVAFLNSWQHYILPLCVLSVRPCAQLSRVLTNSLRQALAQDYVRMAKAKGLSSLHVLVRHALKNSLVPFLSYLPPLCVGLLSGSFLIEVLFAIPGMGSLFVQALESRDINLILGLTLFYGSILILLSELVDVLILKIDPRIRKNI